MSVDGFALNITTISCQSRLSESLFSECLENTAFLFVCPEYPQKRGSMMCESLLLAIVADQAPDSVFETVRYAIQQKPHYTADRHLLSLGIVRDN